MFVYFVYQHPGKGIIGLAGADYIITFDRTSVNLSRNTTIICILTVSGTISNTTLENRIAALEARIVALEAK